MPVTDIVRTGDNMSVPQEGMRKANGGKVGLSTMQQCIVSSIYYCPLDQHCSLNKIVFLIHDALSSTSPLCLY